MSPGNHKRMLLQQKGLQRGLTFHIEPRDLLSAEFFPLPGFCTVAVAAGAPPHPRRSCWEAAQWLFLPAPSSVTSWDHGPPVVFSKAVWRLRWATQPATGPEETLWALYWYCNTNCNVSYDVWGLQLAFCGQFVGFCLVARSQAVTNHWWVIPVLWNEYPPSSRNFY